MPILPVKNPPKPPKKFFAPRPIVPAQRFSITELTDKIPDLKSSLKNVEGLHPGLLQYLNDILDKIKGNSATIDLHEVEKFDGLEGCDLHISIGGKNHGVQKATFYQRPKVTPEIPEGQSQVTTNP